MQRNGIFICVFNQSFFLRKYFIIHCKSIWISKYLCISLVNRLFISMILATNEIVLPLNWSITKFNENKSTWINWSPTSGLTQHQISKRQSKKEKNQHKVSIIVLTEQHSFFNGNSIVMSNYGNYFVYDHFYWANSFV